MRLLLTNPQQAAVVMRDLWPRVRAHLMSGGRLVLRIEREKKSRPQENKYHAQIADIARQCEHASQRFNDEDIKRLLVDQFYRDTKDAPELRDEWEAIRAFRIVPSLDWSGFVMLGAQTRDFSEVLASAFVDWLYSWGAQHGITFTEDT